MINLPPEDEKRSLLGWTLKSVAIIAGLSWLASGWLASATRDQDTLARLAQNISRGVTDPLTTGSLAGKAASSRLDPCAAPKR